MDKQFKRNNNNIISHNLGNIIEECEAMINYALGSGKSIPADSLNILNETKNINDKEEKDYIFLVQEIIKLHNKLSKIIEPAAPSTVLLIHKNKIKYKSWTLFGAIPFIRIMVGITACLIIFFIGLCFFPEINSDTINANVLLDRTVNQNEVIIVLLFYLVSSGLGACFSILFEANRYVVRGTFDYKYESIYWIKFVLGITSGLILVSLFPDEFFKIDLNNGNTILLIKPLIAMIGGFSAQLLYKILKRIVDAIESLISGSPAKIIETEETSLKAKVEEDKIRNVLHINTKLNQLQSEINENMTTKEIKSKINTVANDMLPVGVADDLNYIKIKNNVIPDNNDLLNYDKNSQEEDNKGTDSEED